MDTGREKEEVKDTSSFPSPRKGKKALPGPWDTGNRAHGEGECGSDSSKQQNHSIPPEQGGEAAYHLG